MLKRPDITTVAKPTPIRRLQALLVFFITAGAVIWCVLSMASARPKAIFNPGPMASCAHAAFEQDCKKCHDGAEGGPLSLKVSDTACLACHKDQFPPHAQNQKLGKPGSHVQLVTAIQLSPGHLRSSNCTSCHVEHRTTQDLLDKTNAACLQCHDNVKVHAQIPGKVVCPNSVMAFKPDLHPNFGHELVMGGVRLNPTVLKFNHAKHADVPDQDGFSIKGSNCQACHTNSSQDKRYMQPVLYASTCVHCHSITLDGGDLVANVTHQDIRRVRQEIRKLPDLYLTTLNQLPTVKQQALLYKGTDSVPDDGTAEFFNKRPPTDFKSPQEMVKTQLSNLGDRINTLSAPIYPDAYKRLHDAIGDAPATLTVTGADGNSYASPNADLVEHYLAFEAQTNCIYCHSVTGEVQAVCAKNKSSDHPPTLLDTLPVHAPGVVFANARFNHEAHKIQVTGQTCISCHARVNDTIVKISPDQKIAWDQQQLFETGRILEPIKLDSCIRCHSAGAVATSGGATTGSASPVLPAGSNCTECHEYHQHPAPKNISP